MPNLHVLSYNIHKGFDITNRSHVLRDIKKSIQAVGADLVFLQEVLGEHQTHKKNYVDWPETSQFEFLADKIWPHYAYGRNAVHSEGHHGNAILSKYPITFFENLNISTNRFEKRGMLHAKIKVKGIANEVHVICLHLDLLEAGRKKQLERLCRHVENVVPNDSALIVGGDFNDWRERATDLLHQRLGLYEAFQIREGQHAKTFPAALPFFKLDRFYVRGVSIEKAVVLKDGIWPKLSDHAAIFAEFKL